MAKRPIPGIEMEIVERAQPVVLLRRAGFSYRRIAELTGISKSTCQQWYLEALAQLPAMKDLKQHRAEVFADLEALIEILRAVVHDDEVVSDKRTVAAFLGALDRKKSKLLGLEAPSQSEARVMYGQVGDAYDDPETVEYLTKLAVWARMSNAINAEGYAPALPTGTTEYVTELTGRTMAMWRRRELCGT